MILAAYPRKDEVWKMPGSLPWTCALPCLMDTHHPRIVSILRVTRTLSSLITFQCNA